MRHLVIGYKGEIGSAIYKIIEERGEDLVGIDKGTHAGAFGKVDIMHICIPYVDYKQFTDAVKEYEERYKPTYVVVHSTTPPGTCDKHGWTHSPCRGIHPNLVEGIKTHRKWVAGKDADEIADAFRRLGLRVRKFDKAIISEQAKSRSTLRYGVDIEFAKDTYRECKNLGTPFSAVYTQWTQDYNDGYDRLGLQEYIRPIIEPLIKKIAGHCVLPNLEFIESKFSKFIKKLNK